MTAPGERVDSVERAAAMPYTLEHYRGFLADLDDAGYSFVGFDDGVHSGDIALRHDVDLSLDRALAMARLEADLGIESTYFVLLTTSVYNTVHPANTSILRQLTDLGHDVGVHFNAHGRWLEQPSDAEIVAAAGEEYRVLDQLVDDPVETVAIHRPPDWALDTVVEGLVHTYQPRFFSEITYVSDSNQKWRRERPFPDGYPEAAQVLVHPGLWGSDDSPLEAVFERTKQRAYADVDDFVDPMGRWLHRR